MKSPQPIPYQGSKRLQAARILSYMPPQFIRLVEPFAGSAAISYAVAIQNRSQTFLINDLNQALIHLLQNIIETPELISEQYTKLWNEQIGQEKTFYQHIRSEFNQSQQPHHFLYLLARCVKGAVRYNQKGAFNQSADHRRRGKKPENMQKEIYAFSAALKGKCQFTALNYTDLFNQIKTTDLLYLDPPYQGTSNSIDSRYLSGLRRAELIESLHLLNHRKISYLLSYDGKLGNKEYGEELPQELKLKKIAIETGRSATATLQGKTDKTTESLYISPQLQSIL